MKNRVLIYSLIGILSLNITAFAGQWQQDATGFWWQNDDGSYPTNSWQWLDGNQDGIAECYYFNESGYMLADTTAPDGYVVDATGAWVIDGVVQTQMVSNEASTENSTGGRLAAYNSNGITETVMRFFNSTRAENDARYKIVGEVPIGEAMIVQYEGDFDVWYKGDYPYKVESYFKPSNSLIGIDDNLPKDSDAVAAHLQEKGIKARPMPGIGNMVEFKIGDFYGQWMINYHSVWLYEPPINFSEDYFN